MRNITKKIIGAILLLIGLISLFPINTPFLGSWIGLKENYNVMTIFGTFFLLSGAFLLITKRLETPEDKALDIRQKILKIAKSEKDDGKAVDKIVKQFSILEKQVPTYFPDIFSELNPETQDETTNQLDWQPRNRLRIAAQKYF